MKKIFTYSLFFMISAHFAWAQVPANNECTGAIDLTTGLGQPVGQVTTFGPYDNTNATTEPSDPTNGYECFGEPNGGGANPTLENTLWFSFVGDGNTYYIRTNTCAGVTNYIDDGDTQIAVYTGTCGSLTPYVCNEDGPEATSTHYPAGLNVPTAAGVTYYMLVDGFNFNGTLSEGEFCIFISQIATVPCNDPSLSTGNVVINSDTICAGDTLRLDITGVEAPTVGLHNGLSWVITDVDISGTSDPLAAASLIASYTIQSPAPDTSFRLLINDGGLIGTANIPYGTYYFTPVIFGNATPNVPNPVFLSDLTLDTSCTESGASIAVHFLPPGSPLCAPPGLVNNECPGAIDLSTGIGQPVGQITTFGPYDNTMATTEPSDPTNGYECFGEPNGGGANPTLENTLWFSFVGDGNTYYIRTNTCAGVTNYIDDGDTQIAIYTGTCGSLTPYVCNEDGPEATSTHYPAGLNVPTQAGVTYYMLVDGFNFNGALSEGEFCIFMSQIATVSCTDPSLSTGNVTINSDTICANDTLRLDIIGVEAPTVGLYNGLSWVITNADISGSTDPLASATLIASYTIQSPAPDTSFRLLINDGGLIGTANIPYGTYYFTPVIFGNASPNVPNPVFLSDVTLDPTCTVTGSSWAVTFLPPGSPLCITGISSVDSEGFGIINLYPNPVKDEMSVVISAKSNEDVRLTVLDQLGREITNQNTKIKGETTVNISTAKLSSGVYFLRMESGSNIQHIRFVRH